jgi:hypothetical protein
MNYNQLRPVRSAPQATSYVLKLTFIAIVILFLSYATIRSSSVPTQRQETTVGHETIHNIDTGSTSSTLTNAMKVLLHHFPARQGVSSSLLENCNQRLHTSVRQKECIETSAEGLGQSHGDTDSSLHDLQPFEAKVQRPESVNDGSIHGLTLALTSDKVQKRGNKREAYHDNIGNDGNDTSDDCQVVEKEETVNRLPEKDQALRPIQFCSSDACFCKYCPELCQKKGSRGISGYDGTENTLGSIVASKSLQRQQRTNLWEGTCHVNVKEKQDEPSSRSEIDNNEEYDLERLVGLLGPTKYKCSPLDANCHRPHHKKPPVERIPVDMGREDIAAFDFRDLKMFREPTDHEPDEKGPRDQLSVRSDIRDDENEDEEHDLNTLTGSHKQITCGCDPNHTKCRCPQHLALQAGYIQGNKKRDASTLSDVKALQVSPNLEGQNPCKRGKYDKLQECQCSVCTGGLSSWKEISTLRDVREPAGSQKFADTVTAVTPKSSCSPKHSKCPCRDQRPHMVIHESQIDPPTTLANPPGIKVGQTSGLRRSYGNDDFGSSEHINKGNAHFKRSPDEVDLIPTVPGYVTIKRSFHTEFFAAARRNMCSNKWWRGRRYCQHKPSHMIHAKSHDYVAVEPESLSENLHTIGDQSCHELWRVNSACPATNSNVPKLETVPVPEHSLLRRNNTFIDSINHSRCRDKDAMDREVCENNNRTGFWVVCSLLVVVGICGILLVLLTLLSRMRRKRPSPRPLDGGLEYKSGATTPSTSVSEVQLPRVGRPSPCVIRRIDEDDNDNVETGSVCHYTTLDGATDGWAKWIFQRQKCGKKVSSCLTIRFSVPLVTHTDPLWQVCQCQPGRFSPTLITRAPRIPTLKLPQPTLATMRKVSGLGSELDAIQGKQSWKGKEKDNTRIKWASTV